MNPRDWWSGSELQWSTKRSTNLFELSERALGCVRFVEPLALEGGYPKLGCGIVGRGVGPGELWAMPRSEKKVRLEREVI